MLRPRQEKNMGQNWCESRNILFLGVKSMNKVTIGCKIWYKYCLLRLSLLRFVITESERKYVWP